MKKNLLIALMAVIILAGAGTENRIRRTAASSDDIRYIYSPDITALANPYFRIVSGKPDKNAATGKIWDTTVNGGAGGLITEVGITWNKTDIALVDKTSTVGAVYPPIPTTLPDGAYDILVYDGAAPASTDVIKLGRRAIVKNQIIIGWTDL